MANYLAEAFKAFEAIEEDTFEISDKGIEQLDGFLDDSSAFDKDAIEIFDLEAEDEEELKDSYIGEVILDCCVCHEKLFKKKENVVVDEESQMANVGEECPYCFSVDGFAIVGEVAPFQPKKEKEEVEAEEVEEIAEAFEKAGGPFWYFTKHGVQPGSVPKDISIGEVKDTPEGTFFTSDKVLTTKELNDFDIVEKKPLEEDTIKQNGEWVNKGEEELLPEDLGSDVDKYQKWVDYDMKRYHKISDKTNEEVKKAGLQIVKDKYGDYQVIAGRYDESLEEVSVETEDSKIEVKADDEGKVTIETEPKEEACCEEEEVEVIKPLSNEEEKEIKEESGDIEELDDISFDELEESFLKKVYSNVDSYKTASIENKEGKFFVEGVIKFNSGKAKKASFVFESAGKTPRNKYKLIGESLQITPKKNAFKILGSKVGNKFVSESMNYDYRAKNLEESLRVNGRVVRKLGE